MSGISCLTWWKVLRLYYHKSSEIASFHLKDVFQTFWKEFILPHLTLLKQSSLQSSLFSTQSIQTTISGQLFYVYVYVYAICLRISLYYLNRPKQLNDVNPRLFNTKPNIYLQDNMIQPNSTFHHHKYYNVSGSLVVVYWNSVGSLRCYSLEFCIEMDQQVCS